MSTEPLKVHIGLLAKRQWGCHVGRVGTQCREGSGKGGGGLQHLKPPVLVHHCVNLVLFWFSLYYVECTYSGDINQHMPLWLPKMFREMDTNFSKLSKQFLINLCPLQGGYLCSAMSTYTVYKRRLLIVSGSWTMKCNERKEKAFLAKVRQARRNWAAAHNKSRFVEKVLEGYKINSSQLTSVKFPFDRIMNWGHSSRDGGAIKSAWEQPSMDAL